MRNVVVGDGPVGLYVHVPFCERKCAYCDFYSLENHDGTAGYLTALEQEIARAVEPGQPVRARTVYFGGGTPSVLAIEQLQHILGWLRRSFAIDDDAEVTIEVNPGTVDRDALTAYRSAGFNRLSIGVQSFDPAALTFLGRIHSAADARRCIADARAAGFTNISIDLIYAVPGQSDEEWYATLEEAVSLHPEHISAYSLIVEEQTPLFTQVREGKVIPHADVHEAALYEGTMGVLGGAGYDHYEVSNYALPGLHARHNSGYWHHTGYIGFGPSAHSFLAPTGGGPAMRWSNVRSLAGWVGAIRNGEQPLSSREELSAQELFEEGIFLGLRANGLDAARVETLSGVRFSARQRETLKGLLEAGLAVMDGQSIRLTPAGYVLCDEICARVLVP